MEGVEGRDAARGQGANAGAHCAFDQRRRASRPRGRAAAALRQHRRPRQCHGWHRLRILAKPACRPRAPFDHVGEAEMPRGGRHHRLEAALALTSASTEWRLSGADLPLLERSTNANDCPKPDSETGGLGAPLRVEADLSTQARIKAACELTAQPKLGNGRGALKRWPRKQALTIYRGAGTEQRGEVGLSCY